MTNYLEIANRPVFWLVSAPAVLFIVLLGLVFYRQAVKTAPIVDLTK